MSFTLRLLHGQDSELVFSFLTIAARMVESGEPIQKALVDPELRKYWEGWGKSDDFGVVAVRDLDAVPIACAWLRKLEMHDDPSAEHAGALELACGTIQSERGRGVGGLTLARLLDLADTRAQSVTLTVRSDNPALRLYERSGFRATAELTNRVGTRSLRMLRRPKGAAREKG